MRNNYSYKYSKEFFCLQKLDENGAILDAMQMPEGDLLKVAQLLKGTENDRTAIERESN